ncbi:zinc-dependent peptidase [bacterium]|nr:zinc-dependent peptidase [candidate division CSSED10-310 bacterium]
MTIFPRHKWIEHSVVAGGFGFLVFALVSRTRSIPLAAGVSLGVAVMLIALFQEKYIRRFLLLKHPFPESWRRILVDRVRFYRLLSPEDRIRFEQDVMVFLSEQRIYGIRGQAVAEDIRVVIAASAATLGFGIESWEWPTMRDILVYPTGFDEDYSIDRSHHLTGIVHQQGPVIFSEEDLKMGYYASQTGYNVGLHEMAHVLDMADGAADGIPPGLSWMATAPWIRVMADRMQKLRKGECRKVLREYAGVNEAEFFAVAVEVFFEKPHILAESDPELFNLMRGYFRIDPRAPSRSP